jgi:thiol-disulfide isomerase/thioredoxin
MVIQTTFQAGLGGGSPLYGPDDKILILNTTNFQPNICSSSKAWVVEFYSSWCGHCIHFAPTYKEFAADVFGDISDAARELSDNLMFQLGEM